MITHRESTPLVFFLSELDAEMRERLFLWFTTRQPDHMFRTLVNHERTKYGFCYEIIFANAIDAVEFKLTFI